MAAIGLTETDGQLAECGHERTFARAWELAQKNASPRLTDHSSSPDPRLRAWLSYLETDYRTAAGGLRFLPSSSAAMSSTLRGASDL
jgi:hypothetical protein